MLNIDEIEARIEENARKNIFAPSILKEMIAEIRQLRRELQTSDVRLRQLSECIRSAPCHPIDRDGFSYECGREGACRVCQWRQSIGDALISDERPAG